MRTDELYLVDILEAVDRLRSHLTGCSLDDFHAAPLIYSAALAELIIAGEAATRLSSATKAQAPEVPWDEIRGFRNLAVHGYFALDAGRVWGIARGPAEDLHRAALRLLEHLHPSTHTAYLARRGGVGGD